MQPCQASFPETAMQLQKGDILIALKAINLTPSLGNRDRSVAAALLDHFNRRTGQCDPGIKRLSGLLGISERTIFRSLKRIEADRLFKRVRHGGHLNRNSYEPNWQRFRELEAIWSTRMKRRSAVETELSAASSHGCQVDPDKGVTQTCRRNLSNETCLRRLPKEAIESTTRDRARPSARPGPSSKDAAYTEAERRWSNALLKYFEGKPVSYGEAVEAIDERMAAAATGAETQQRGAGLVYILRELRLST
jgi:hypothetical protein